MKLGLVIATHWRAEILQQVLTYLLSQQRIPDEIVISAVDSIEIPKIDSDATVQLTFGSAGLTLQRNRGISLLIDRTDVIAW
jgi:hypothetical protein